MAESKVQGSSDSTAEHCAICGAIIDPRTGGWGMNSQHRKCHVRCLFPNMPAEKKDTALVLETSTTCGPANGGHKIEEQPSTPISANEPAQPANLEFAAMSTIQLLALWTGTATPNLSARDLESIKQILLDRRASVHVEELRDMMGPLGIQLTLSSLLLILGVCNTLTGEKADHVLGLTLMLLGTTMIMFFILIHRFPNPIWLKAGAFVTFGFAVVLQVALCAGLMIGGGGPAKSESFVMTTICQFMIGSVAVGGYRLLTRYDNVMEKTDRQRIEEKIDEMRKNRTH